MRLGDLDALEKRIVAEENEIITDNHHAIGLHNGLALAQAMVINAPTIDAVPVVRCKDCKEFRTGTAMTFTEKGKHVRYCSCDKLGRLMRDDDFCSYGEPKDGDA